MRFLLLSTSELFKELKKSVEFSSHEFSQVVVWL